MAQILDLFPLLAFVVTYFWLNGHQLNVGSFHYQFDGIYSATAVLMASTLLQVLILWLWKHRVEKQVLGLLVISWIFGALTLFFHNKLFIQWKPTLFNWAMAVVTLGSLATGKNIVERLLGKQLSLPASVALRLTWIWGLYFFTVGALNLFVAYHFSEATWVSYKLWSALLFTLLISTLTAVVVTPYLKADGTGNPPHDPPSSV